MTRQQIRALARKRLGEVSGVFWDDSELNSWFDDAGRDLAWRTKSIRTNGYLTSVASTADYALSTNFPNLLSVLQVYFKINGTTWRKLEPISSREQFDIEYFGWMNTAAGVPHRYHYDKEEDNLMIWPKPNSSNAGSNYIRVYYARTYTAITSDSGTPALPEPLHLAMADYIAMYGYETRGYGDKANDAMSKYEKRIADYLRERLREKEDDEIVMRSYRDC